MNKTIYYNILLMATLVLVTSCSKRAILTNDKRLTENLSGIKSSPEALADPATLEVSVVSSPVIHQTLPPVDHFTETNTSVVATEKGSAVAAERTAKRNVNAENKTKIKEVKELIRSDQKYGTQRTGIGTLLLVIFAIILPPLAVLLVDGLRGPFWLSILLTLLFYVPGLIYALYRVFRVENM